MEEREKVFLVGLAKLTRKTGISIAGCGCFGGSCLAVVGKDINAGYWYDGSYIVWGSASDGWMPDDLASIIK